MRALIWLIALGILCAGAVPALIRTQKPSPPQPEPARSAMTETVARIESGQGAPIQVRNVQIRFARIATDLIDFYDPRDYPTLRVIPLSSGNRADFSLIRKVVFANVTRTARTFVEERDRARYVEGAIDKDGFATTTSRLIEATISTPTGETIVDTVRCPPFAAVTLIGDTAIGDFSLDLLDLTQPLTVELERVAAVPQPGN